MKPWIASLLALTMGLTLPGPMAWAAINPAGFQTVASDRVQLRELARIVHLSQAGAAQLRRVTIVGVVLEGRRMSHTKVGDTIVIDYTVDLSERERAVADHARRQGQMPGPQFMAEPDPPQADEQGRFWAHLAPLGGRLGNVNRHAGAVPGIGDYAVTGPVFVPVAGPYSFWAPL